MDFNRILDLLKNLEAEDIFPLYNNSDDTHGLLTASGVYLGIIIVSILLITLLGGIFILGVLIKIISVIAIIYSIIGMFAGLFRYMKFN